MDAVLDSLAERARARHPRAGLPAHLSCLLSPLHLASDSTRELQGLQEVHSLRRYLGPAQQGAVPVTLPADTHVVAPGIESTSHFSQLFHRPHVRSSHVYGLQHATRCHESAERTQHVHTPNGARAALLLCGVRTRDVVCRVCVSVCVVRGVCLCHLVSVSVSKSNHLLPPWRWLKRKHTYDMEHVQARPLKVR